MDEFLDLYLFLINVMRPCYQFNVTILLNITTFPVIRAILQRKLFLQFSVQLMEKNDLNQYLHRANYTLLCTHSDS